MSATSTLIANLPETRLATVTGWSDLGRLGGLVGASGTVAPQTNDHEKEPSQMKPLTLLLVAFLLLAGASAASASLGSDTAVRSAIPDSALDGATPLTPTEMAALTGSAPDWVVAACVGIGGFTGGRSAVVQIAKQLGKRVVIGTLCPVCGTAMTIAALGCIFL